MVEVLGKVGDCFLVIFCVGVGAGESFCLTALWVPGGWEEEKWRYWNVFVFLKNVLTSSRFLEKIHR